MAKDIWDKIFIIFSLLFALGALIVSIHSLLQTNKTNIDLRELKADTIDAIKIIAEEANIQNISEVNGITFKSGGQILSGQ